MKFQFEELGIIRQAELTLGDLTIICGKNNTGKTYITYAVYGFLDYWRKESPSRLRPLAFVNELLSTGSVDVSSGALKEVCAQLAHQYSRDYSQNIGGVFAGSRKRFQNTKIKVEINGNWDVVPKKMDAVVRTSRRDVFEIRIEGNAADSLHISLIANQPVDQGEFRGFTADLVSRRLRDMLFGNLVPRPFIASAERTGSAIFQKELDFTRNRVVDLLKDERSGRGLARMLGRFSADYPIPVRDNVDFIRGLSNAVKQDSVFLQQNPSVLDRFTRIIGGEYHVTREGEVQYLPAKKRGVKLAMVESSSAVRSLLDIGFYLRHIARPNDLLVVDEPELNLHPENQRLVARLFAMLVNCGIKVLITTHSDYIIKELSTLMMLNQPDDKRLCQVAVQEGYEPLELLSANKLKVYMAQEGSVKLHGKSRRSKCHTLVAVPACQDTGIALDSFDDTIEEMNRIQDEIVWGE